MWPVSGCSDNVAVSERPHCEIYRNIQFYSSKTRRFISCSRKAEVRSRRIKLSSLKSRRASATIRRSTIFQQSRSSLARRVCPVISRDLSHPFRDSVSGSATAQRSTRRELCVRACFRLDINIYAAREDTASVFALRNGRGMPAGAIGAGNIAGGTEERAYVRGSPRNGEKWRDGKRSGNDRRAVRPFTANSRC